MVALAFRRQELDSTVAALLIGELNAELAALYPEQGANHFRLDPAEVSAGRGVFLVAYESDQPVGCGALRRIDPDVAEVKRMYVRRAARGRRLGAAILSALEAEARALGVSRLVLETGDRLAVALALYRRAGFQPVPAFGEYVDSPLSFCLGKTLTS
jgi:putative acetyltransferase